MGRDLATDFAARETRSVHIRIGGPGAERAQEASEVMLVEGLIGGCARRVQSNDVCCSRCARDRTGSSLRAIGLLRNVRVPLGPAAEICHHGIIHAFKAEMNMRD